MSEDKKYINGVTDFCCFLIDRHERETITEEIIRDWLLDFPKSQYCKDRLWCQICGRDNAPIQNGYCEECNTILSSYGKG